MGLEDDLYQPGPHVGFEREFLLSELEHQGA